MTLNTVCESRIDDVGEISVNEVIASYGISCIK